MGGRLRLGGGFSVGRSGVRYGTRIGKVYVNAGRSGTLISGGPIRYWLPAGKGRRSAGGPVPRCGGTTKAGSRCTNSATQGVVCRRHIDQTEAVTAALAEAPESPPSGVAVAADGPRRSVITKIAWIAWIAWTVILLAGFMQIVGDEHNVEMGTNISGAFVWFAIWVVLSIAALMVGAVFRAGMTAPQSPGSQPKH